MGQQKIKKILFLFSFFFLFSLITQPFSNVQAATKKSSFSTETSGNKTSLKGTGATPDSPGSNLTTTAVKLPTTASPGKPGIGTGGNSTGTNSSSSSTTAAKKEDKKYNKTKVSDDGKTYPSEIDKPLEKVCYDMVRDTLNVTLGKEMKQVIAGKTTGNMMESMKSVYTGIVSPVGEALIVLFFLIELIDKTTKDNFSLEHFFKLML